jgi:hypothetical protein
MFILLNKAEILINRIIGISELKMIHPCLCTNDNSIKLGHHYFLLKEQFLPIQLVLIKRISIKNNHLRLRIYSYTLRKSFTISTVLNDPYMFSEWQIEECYDENDPSFEEIDGQRIDKNESVENQDLLCFDF